MIFSEFFKKLFKLRKSNTIVLNKNSPDNDISKNRDQIADKSIFEIIYTIAMKDNISMVSGRIKRGFFKIGDMVDICSPSEVIPKFRAVIINIKTALVEVNRIGNGSEADLLIKVPENSPEIKPGDRVYKV